MTDNAFAPGDGYEVNRKKYEKHQPHTYTEPNKPVVRLQMQKDEFSKQDRICILVDTGADVSTLSGDAADRLDINRWPEGAEQLKAITGISGNDVVGYRRKIQVYLGWQFQEVEVFVEPHPGSLDTSDQDQGKPAVLPVKRNLLGRAGIFGNYLLCFDSERLYAFPRVKKKPKKKPK